MYFAVTSPLALLNPATSSLLSLVTSVYPSGLLTKFKGFVSVPSPFKSSVVNTFFNEILLFTNSIVLLSTSFPDLNVDDLPS